MIDRLSRASFKSLQVDFHAMLARAEKSCAAWKNAVIGLKGGLEKGQRYVTYADALKCEHKHRMKSGIASLFVNVFCSETVARLLARRFVFELRVE